MNSRSIRDKIVTIETEVPFLIRRGCISRYDRSGKVRLCAPRKLALHRVPRGTYAWELVGSGSYDVSVPSGCSLVCHEIGRGEGLVVRLENLLGVERRSFPKTKLFLDVTSFIDHQHLYRLVTGPSRVILAGGGEVRMDEICEGDSGVYDRGSVIAYGTGLSKASAIVSSSIMRMLILNDLFSDSYEGEGLVFRQSAGTALMSAAAGGASRLSALDILQIFGLG